MRAMISQPMKGKSDKEIVETREQAVECLKRMGCDEVLNTFFAEEWCSDNYWEEKGVVHIPLFFLAKSLEYMSMCDMVYFTKGWEDARGCRLEHEAAKAYGLEIVYE